MRVIRALIGMWKGADGVITDEVKCPYDDNAAVTRKLHSTTDAMVWAEEWCRIARRLRDQGDEIIDAGWMVGWFANAMEIAKDHERRRIADTLDPASAFLRTL